MMKTIVQGGYFDKSMVYNVEPVENQLNDWDPENGFYEDYDIKNYFKDLTQNKLCALCYEIMRKYKRASRKMREFHFDRRYPKDTMVKKMKPIKSDR